jgi:hypothetical protein
MISACGMSSTATNPLGARQIQSIALTTGAAVEMHPASVESSTGWETCVLSAADDRLQRIASDVAGGKLDDSAHPSISIDCSQSQMHAGPRTAG